MASQAKGRGVLPINPAATRKPQKPQQRTPAVRLRLIVRRLPPGLSEAEFWEALGDEWTVGKGKVEWAAFKPGKISKDLANPSRPGRAYLKLKDSSLLELLSTKVKQTPFQDAKGTTKDSCLVGPPSLEFAPYNRVPGSRSRNDGRQGTIDQDPEFIDFLQSLTEPITKSAANGTEADSKAEKATTTPLVQFIKDKKANKAKEKEAASTKASKKAQDVKDSKSAASNKGDAKGKNVVVKGTMADSEKARVSRATQDTVQAVGKSVSSLQHGKPGSSTVQETKSPKKESAQSTQAPQSTPKRERQRGDANAAARIVARDLGLVPKEGRTPRGPRAQAAQSGQPSTPASTTTASTPVPGTGSTPANSNVPTAPAQPPTGPRAQRPGRQNTSAPVPTASANIAPRPLKQAPQPSANAKSAFLKHANPSQGVTEELLNEVFGAFGKITRCEIDKKKGLGYIDFAATEGLRDAMAASPVKVGNSNVVVLENRSPYKKVNRASPKPPSVASPAISAASSPIPALAVPSTASIAPSTAADPSPEANVASSAPVLDPQLMPDAADGKSSEQTGSTPTAPAQGADPPTNAKPPMGPKAGRGGPKGNFRGGRGGFRGRGGQAHRGNFRNATASPQQNAQQDQAPSTPAASNTSNPPQE